MSGMRVGLGVDVHPFSPHSDRLLVLGGVHVPGPGLAGHSDADVLSHAVTDAVLGAAGLGDMGEHFPDSDEKWRGADSIAMLRHAVGVIGAEGWSVANVDATVTAEVPKLAPHRQAMIANLSTAVGAPASVKATTAEGLGAIGRSEGIACWAIALVERSS